MIRIKFTKLGVVAQNRVAATAQGEAILQLSEGESLRLSKQVLKVSDLGKISGEYAIPITVDASDVNNAILSEYNSPAVLRPRIEYDVIVSVDSVLLPFTRARVIEYDEDKYTLQLLYSNNHWLQASSLLNTCDVDMGIYEIAKNAIIQNWNNYDTGDSDVLLTFADYGNWVDERIPPANSSVGAKTIGVEDVRPFFRLSAFLQKGFCKIGWSLKSDLFKLAFVNALTVYDLRPDYAEVSRRKSIVAGKNNGPVTITGSNINDQARQFRVSEQTQNLDKYFIPAGTNRWFCGVINYSRANLRYRIKLSVTVEASAQITMTLAVMRCSFILSQGGFIPSSLLSTPQSYTIPANTPTRILFESTFVADTNITDTPKTFGSAVFITGVPITQQFTYTDLDFVCEQHEQAYFKSSFVDVAKESFSKKTTLLDHLKGFCHIFDARIEEDLISREITIHPNRTIEHPSDTNFAEKFRRNGYSIMSDNFVPGTARVKPVLPTSQRSVLFSWKATSDAYIKSLNLQREIYSREITFAKRANAEMQKVQNPTYEPTAERQTKLLATAEQGRRASPFFPVMLDNTDGRRSFNIAPRILLYWGQVQQYKQGATSLKPATYFFDLVPEGGSGVTANFPYLSMLPTWELLASNFDKSVTSLVWGRRPFDLFSMSYLGFVANRRGGSEVTAEYRISIREYLQEDFRRLLRFKFRGRDLSAWPVLISEYAAGAEGEAKVKMEMEPADPSCCDQPCGCVYSACDYAQPFTVETLGAVVAASAVTDFFVNGVSQISAPLPLGQMNIIELNEGPYVTNLPDALNAVDAELANFLRFEYSSEKDGNDVRRFFKVVRPACWSFKITVEVSGGPTIEYTQDANTDIEGFDQPINCTQYEEY